MTDNPTFKIVFFDSYSFNENGMLQKVCTQVIQDNNSSIGVDFYTKDIIIKKKLFKLQIWKLHTESKKFKFLNPTYCMGISGALIAINLSRDFSTEEIHSWIKMIKTANQNAPIILICIKPKDFIEKSSEKISNLDENIKFDKTFIIKSQSKKKISKIFTMLTKVMLKNING